MGEKFVTNMGENVVKRRGEKSMSENFVKRMGENVVKRMGEKRWVKKVWVKTL